MSDNNEDGNGGELAPIGADAGLIALQGMIGSLTDAAQGTESIKADAQKEIEKMRFEYVQRDREREAKWRDKMSTGIFKYVIVPWSLLFIGMFGWLLFKERLDILGTIATHVVAVIAGLLPGFALGQRSNKSTK